MKQKLIDYLENNPGHSYCDKTIEELFEHYRNNRR